MATGFLFAFLRFDRLERPSMLQRAVRLVVRSETVHVAVLPVHHYDPSPSVWVDGQAYTAFIKHGACVQEAAHVLEDPAYDFVFLPVPNPADFARGLALLERMKTAHYNYATLLLAILPSAFKSAHMPNWLTGEDGMHLDPTAPAPPIFCSQMGMLLCHECGALDAMGCDPAVCLPADLEEALLTHARAIQCAPQCIHTLTPPRLEEAAAPKPA